MMKITVQNGQLFGMIQFLNDINLKGQASLGRTKLKEKLIKKHTTYGEDERAVIVEFADWTNEEEGTYEWKEGKAEEGKDTLKELKEKEVEVDLFDYAKWSKVLKDKILDYDGELSGIKADAWAVLVEQFDTTEEEKL